MSGNLKIGFFGIPVSLKKNLITKLILKNNSRVKFYSHPFGFQWLILFLRKIKLGGGFCSTSVVLSKVGAALLNRGAGGPCSAPVPQRCLKIRTMRRIRPKAWRSEALCPFLFLKVPLKREIRALCLVPDPASAARSEQGRADEWEQNSSQNRLTSPCLYCSVAAVPSFFPSGEKLAA